jgi:hypothetical protein
MQCVELQCQDLGDSGMGGISLMRDTKQLKKFSIQATLLDQLGDQSELSNHSGAGLQHGEKCLNET